MNYSESLALLEKYGLKSDTKSIKERLDTIMSFSGFSAFSIFTDSREVYAADLAVLFHRADNRKE